MDETIPCRTKKAARVFRPTVQVLPVARRNTGAELPGRERGEGQMKKLFLLLILGAVGFGGYRVYEKFGSPAAPYLAYQRRADAEVKGASMAGNAYLQSFGGPVVNVEAITYELESMEHLAEDRVELVAVQTVQRRYQQDGPSRPYYTRSRHHVVLEESGGKWTVAQMSGEKLD
jgi:hypothetical protein